MWFAEEMHSKGAKCVIPPTVNPGMKLKYLNERLLEVSDAGMEIVSSAKEACRKLGAQLNKVQSGMKLSLDAGQGIISIL